MTTLTVSSANFTYYLAQEDAAIDNYRTRVTAAGGSASAAVYSALDTFVKALKANNVWDKMIQIFPMAGDNAASGLIPLTDTAALTNGGATYSASGFSFTNGQNVDTGQQPSAIFPTTTNVGIWAYAQSVASSGYAISISSASTFELSPRATSGGNQGRLLRGNISATSGTNIGLFGLVNDAVQTTLYQGSNALATNTDAAIGFPSNNILIGQRPALVTGYANSTLGLIAFTQALTQAEVTNFATAVNALMTAFGR